MREVQNGKIAARLVAWRALSVGAVYVALFVFDRTLKWLARTYQPEQSGWLSWRYHLNSEGLFSLPVPPFVLVTLGVMAAAALIHLALTNLNRLRSWPACGLMLMVIGGASNLMDRLSLGGVVDMFYVTGGLTFNLADVYLLSGVGITLAASRVKG